MNTLMAVVLMFASWNAEVGALRLAPPSCVCLQDGSSPAVPGKEQIVIRKDGGPGHGPDQPYSVREQGARDLEGFAGGYLIVEGPIDLVVLLLIVVLVVVLVIVL